MVETPLSPEARARLVALLLDRHGTSYARELGLSLAEGGAEARFRWLCAALLLSARIAAPVAMRAAAALAEAGWTSARAMAESRSEDRVRVLNRAGYARYDESTARMLGDTAATLRDAYGGDPDALRARAGGDVGEMRRLLKEFKGIGDVGADIFLREMQGTWPGLYPFADARSRCAAARLGLPDTPQGLAALVPRADFPRLLAALIRADLARDTEALRAEAGRAG